ncbi:AzlC family ABC transporter permease [Parafannyhessea sp. LCP21S3_E6]|uniref:AzlC family ABC transporter permease n=1 Tax=unclassified Parafannyhessea TaxID=2847323 RepID=UPI003F96B8B7
MRREVISAAWPVMVSYVAVGLPCGVLAAKAGMGPLQNFVLALTFLSGGGQFMMSNLWLAGVPLGSIVASVAAVSTRFALYSASLAPYLERFGRRSALAISCSYTEEAYGITLDKLASGAAWSARDALALNLCVQLTWAASCAAGAALGAIVNVPTAIAGFAMTSLFIYLLWAQPHTRPTAAAAAAAALTVAACKWAGAAGVAVPVAALLGVAAGLAAGALPHARRGRHNRHELNHERPAAAANAPTGEKDGPR